MITTVFKCLGCLVLLNAKISSNISDATRSFGKPRFPVPMAGKDMEVRPLSSALPKQSFTMHLKCWKAKHANHQYRGESRYSTFTLPYRSDSSRQKKVHRVTLHLFSCALSLVPTRRNCMKDLFALQLAAVCDNDIADIPACMIRIYQLLEFRSSLFQDGD